MLQHTENFHRPSTKHRTLSILETLAEDSSLSQAALGEQTGLSSAMINSYLKDLQKHHLITAEPVNARNFNYILTEQGQSLRRELFGEYCAEVVRSYTAIKGLVRTKLASLLHKKQYKLALFGAAETCEVVLAALHNSPFTVEALFDTDPEKQGTYLAGYRIKSPALLETTDCDAVLITSFTQSDTITRQIHPVINKRCLAVVRL